MSVICHVWFTGKEVYCWTVSSALVALAWWVSPSISIPTKYCLLADSLSESTVVRKTYDDSQTTTLDFVRLTRFVCSASRFEYIACANVYIRNSAAQSTRWPRHCQSVSRDRWTAHIPDTGYRTNSGYRRRLAIIIRYVSNTWSLHSIITRAFLLLLLLVFVFVFPGLAICPAILQLILLPVCPESPRYLLITKQWEEEARKGMFLFNSTKTLNIHFT